MTECRVLKNRRTSPECLNDALLPYQAGAKNTGVEEERPQQPPCGTPELYGAGLTRRTQRGVTTQASWPHDWRRGFRRWPTRLARARGKPVTARPLGGEETGVTPGNQTRAAAPAPSERL